MQLEPRTDLRARPPLRARRWGAALTDWGVFELQLVLLTNIRAIPPPALTAGAIWITAEGAFASIQSGWIAVAKMRTLKLLGQRDRGAPRSFVLMLLLSLSLVSLCCVPLYVPATAAAISRLVSNDADVARWFARLTWVLALKSQTRLVQVALNALFVPMGLGRARVLIGVVGFVLLAAPFAAVAALTDLLTTSVLTKLRLCVACASIGEAFSSVGCALVLLRLDWARTAEVVHARAHTDAAGSCARGADPRDVSTPTCAPIVLATEESVSVQ